MTNTRTTGRFGDPFAEDESRSESELEASRERYWKALRGEYTEADIAALEQGDLTEPGLESTLDAAYEHQDPTDRSNIMCWRRPSTFVSEAELEARVRETEAKLKQNPKDYETRVIRLEALATLARYRKREAILREAADHRAGTRERQGLTPMEGYPGWEGLLKALSEAAERHETDGEPWQVTALGETNGLLQIASTGGDGFTRGLEQLAHIASGYICQRCGAPGRECCAGLAVRLSTLCEGCQRKTNAEAVKRYRERAPGEGLSEEAKASGRKLAALTNAAIGTPEEIAAVMEKKARE